MICEPFPLMTRIMRAPVMTIVNRHPTRATNPMRMAKAIKATTKVSDQKGSKGSQNITCQG